jgi:hypothetical protein
LLAQGAAAEAVDGLHLLEDGWALLQKVIKFQGCNESIETHYATTKMPSCLLFYFGLLSGHTPGRETFRGNGLQSSAATGTLMIFGRVGA